MANNTSMRLILRPICIGWFFFWTLLSTINAQLPAQDSLRRLLVAHPQQDDRRAELLNGLAFLLHTSQPDQTLIYADEVIGFADKIKHIKNVSSAYSMKSIAYLTKSDFKNAEIWAEKSLEIDQRIHNKEGIASNTSNLGLIYYRQNKYPYALARFQEAARLFKETNNPNERMMYLNMSAVYAENKNFRKAEEYIQIARERNREINDPRLEGYALLNLGTLYTDEEDYQKGRLYLDSALMVNKQINDLSNIAKVYGNLGYNAAKTHDYQHAKDYYQQALAINISLGNSRSIAVDHCGIGESLIMLDSLPQAYEHLSISLAISRQLNVIDVQQAVSENLSQYFEKTAHLDSALYYHKQLMLFKDSLNNEANKKQLTRLELQYDFDLKEQKYLQQQALSKLQIKQLWLYGALLIVVLISLGGYLLNRAHMRRIRQGLLLQQQLSESELKAIRSQMNPHFIFNVLNSIESYVLDNEAKTASSLIQQFAQLTRLVLENSTQSLVSADREWSAIQLYVALEAVRFDHGFNYRFEVDPNLDLSSIVLPPMLIQPLVENAILHGLRNLRTRRGMLQVRASLTNEQVVFTILDNGLGLTASHRTTEKHAYKKKSLGTIGIRERLALLASQYPASPPSLTITEITTPGESGTCSQLVLPMLTAVDEPSTQ